MWSFKIVLCRSVGHYIKNLDDCRGIAAVYRSTTVALSLIPLTGIGNFYSGNSFDGNFELAEGLIALFSLWCGCVYCCNEFQRRHDDNPLLCCELIWSLLLAAINIVRYIICAVSTNSLEFNYELSLAMVTVVISLIFCYCGCAEKRCLIGSGIVNVIVVGLMEMIRDVHKAANNENDGNGCPFI